MFVLALETTSNHGSLALLQDDSLLALRRLDPRQYAVQIHALAQALLDEHNLQLSNLGLFAVADGPGSFTGVRLGLTAVKGWCEVLGIPAAPVSTLRAVAAAAELGATPVLAALDASRGEIYYGLYPEGTEGLASAEEFRDLLGSRPGFSPHAALCEQFPELRPTTPDLAPFVGRLGHQMLNRGEGRDSLRLDARYIRRSDAELFAPAAP